MLLDHYSFYTQIKTLSMTISPIMENSISKLGMSNVHYEPDTRYSDGRNRQNHWQTGKSNAKLSNVIKCKGHKKRLTFSSTTRWIPSPPDGKM